MRRKSMKQALLVSVFLLSAVAFTETATAQGGDYETVFISTQNGLLNSVELPARGELKMHIGHRFGELNGGFYEFFGLDEATMRLAFEWGATKWLGVSLGRSTWEKTYDLGAKFELLRHNGPAINLAASLFTGWSVNTLRDYYPADRDNIGSRSTIYLQLLLAARYKLISLQASPVIMRNNYDPRAGGSLDLFAIPLTGSVRLTKRLGVSAEYIPIFNKPFFADANPLTFSLDIDTGGHQFQLLFSNSRGLTYKTVLSDTGMRWTDGGIYFGFNLVRTFYL
jgi:hypothetical protein